MRRGESTKSSIEPESQRLCRGVEWETFMEFRYLGFSQQGNARVYRFDVIAKGEATKHLTITADINLFLANRVGIQEGPTLCSKKLAGDLLTNFEGAHELTGDDLRRHAAARALADAQRAESRRNTPRRTPETPAPEGSPWRTTRV